MKSTDLWKKLPTATELLENPRVRSVVDRLNPTVVTARVRGFLDEVRGEVSHRAEEAGLPTLSELAERVSRYLTARDHHRLTGAINATGQLRGGPWAGVPLADAALEQMLLAAQDFTFSPHATPVESEAIERVCQLTGAEAALVVHSHLQAIELTLRTLGSPGAAMVARGEVTTIEPGCRLTDLAANAGLQLFEVGAADGVSLDDYRTAAEEGRAILRLAGGVHADQSLARPSLSDLAGCAASSGARLIVELGGAALAGVEGLDACGSPTVAEAVALGADLVLVRGDGLLGGPSCGVVVGKRAAIDRLTSWPLAGAMSLDAPRAAALAATLRLHADADKALLAIPSLALATAPMDNLKTRAERIAQQIENSPQVAKAEAAEWSNPTQPGVPLRNDTWCVRVWPAGRSAAQLADNLRSGTPSVLAAAHDDHLVLDLRSVFPRQDIALVAAFEGSDPDGPEDQSVEHSPE